MKKIGILGGMGPQASIRFYDLIIKNSIEKYGAKNNDDFPHILLSNLNVPDLISNRRSEIKAVSMVVEEAKVLERAGCDFIVMSCNTMHLFEKQIQTGLSIPFYSMIDAVTDKARKYKKVGLLGSKSSVQSDLYKKPLETNGVQVLQLPDHKIDETVEIIKSVIENKITVETIKKLNTQVEDLKKGGAECIILGCTELPILKETVDIDIPIIDSLKELSNLACKKIYE